MIALASKSVNWTSKFAFVIAVMAILVAGFGNPAHAQQLQPLAIQEDPNGVDMLSGETRPNLPTLAVPGAPNLQLTRLDELVPYIYGSVQQGTGGDGGVVSNFRVNHGLAVSDSVECLDFECTSTKRNGSTIVGHLGDRRFVYTQGGTGKQVVFDVQYFWSDQQPTGGSAGIINLGFYASEVEFPDGEKHTYHYWTHGVAEFIWRRPIKIVSNRGYEMHFTYQSDTFSWGSNEWNTLNKATIYKSTDLNNALAEHTYTATSITDIDGREWSCTNCLNRLGAESNFASTQLTLPGETTPTYDAIPESPSGPQVVGQVMKDGVTWDYSYINLKKQPCGFNCVDANRFDEMIVTGPEGFSRTIKIAHHPIETEYRPRVGSITDSNGQETSYLQDSHGRVYRVTYPEGNQVNVEYDRLGNITESRQIAKPGSNLPDQVQTAYYPSGDAANTGGLVVICASAHCFRPDWTRDAKGNQTDYTWTTVWAMPETQLDPADENGIRRKTINTYDPMRRLIKTEVCAADAAGNELNCGTADSFVQEFTYWENTLLHETVSVTDGLGQAPLTSSYAYDPAGRQTVADGPLPGSDDAVYSRYDIVGRKTWGIGPQGEDGFRPATFTEYRDADNQVERVKTGYVAGSTTEDPNQAISFIGVITDTLTDYNARRLATKTTVSDDSGAPYSISQVSYDNLNRQDCAAVRMNLTSIPADACTLGTPNANGEQDRITRQHYDTEGRVERIEQGLGTTLVRDHATYTFTPNGQMASMTDARGYKASMMYDGFDRQTHWYFPDPVTTGAINPGDYELYGYDANGNRTSLRKRDGSVLTYQYDNLNRMTRKTVPDGRQELANIHSRDVFYEYDLRDLQLHARFNSDTGPGTTSVYDRYGFITKVTDNTSGTSRKITSQYTRAGSRTRMWYPDGKQFRSYYHPGGQFNHMTAPQGEVFVDYQYTHRGELEEIWRGGGNTPYQKWTFDPIGRMSSSSIYAQTPAHNVTWSYTRNPASQIRTKTQSNDSYTWADFVPLDRSYVTNGLNQYTSVSGETYCYDKNGNLTADGEYVYLYDVENRLVEMRAAPATINCTNLSYAGQLKAQLHYDPLGRLYALENFINGVAQGPITMLYDGDALIAEYNAAGAMLNRYVHGPLQGVDDPIAQVHWRRRSARRPHQSLQPKFVWGAGEHCAESGRDRSDARDQQL